MEEDGETMANSEIKSIHKSPSMANVGIALDHFFSEYFRKIISPQRQHRSITESGQIYTCMGVQGGAACVPVVTVYSTLFTLRHDNRCGCVGTKQKSANSHVIKRIDNSGGGGASYLRTTFLFTSTRSF